MIEILVLCDEYNIEYLMVGAYTFMKHVTTCTQLGCAVLMKLNKSQQCFNLPYIYRYLDSYTKCRYLRSNMPQSTDLISRSINCLAL